jgi:hypothetical protein
MIARITVSIIDDGVRDLTKINDKNSPTLDGIFYMHQSDSETRDRERERKIERRCAQRQQLQNIRRVGGG